MLVLIAAKVANIDYSRTNGPLVPMFAVLTLVHVVVAYVPALSLWLPRAMGFGG